MNQKTWILSSAQAPNKRFHTNVRRGEAGKAEEEGEEGGGSCGCSATAASLTCLKINF